MRFVMYVDEKPVDAIVVSGNNLKISELIKALKEKNKESLKAAGGEPVFVLEQVPSSINGFQPLQEQLHSNYTAKANRQL